MTAIAGTAYRVPRALVAVPWLEFVGASFLLLLSVLPSLREG